MDDVKQHLALGREHYARREFADAEPHLRAVLERTGEYADVHNMLGVIHHDRQDFAAAKGFFEEAVRLNRTYTEAALNLAVTCNDLGLYAESRRTYAAITTNARGAERIDRFARGKLANLHAHVARAYEDLELFPEAAGEYRRALALCPDFADLRTRLGSVLRASGDLRGAVHQFEQAIRHNAKYVPAYVAMGVSLFAMSRPTEAKAAWESALALEPDNRNVQMYLRVLQGVAPSPSMMPPFEDDGEITLSLMPDVPDGTH